MVWQVEMERYVTQDSWQIKLKLATIGEVFNFFLKLAFDQLGWTPPPPKLALGIWKFLTHFLF